MYTTVLPGDRYETKADRIGNWK